MKTILDVNMYDTKEVATMLGVGVATIRNYIRQHKLEATKIGGLQYTSEKSLKKFLEGSNTTEK